MRKITFLAVTLCIACMVSCQDDDNENIFDEKVIELPPQAMEIVSADNEFGINIFKRLLAADPGKNTMISPLSISQALLMTYNGADGDTKTAFEQTLNLGELTVDEVNQAQKKLVTELLEADPNVTLDIANSIWINNNLTVKPEFISVNTDYYDSEVKQLVFDESAANQINNWVKNKTNGKIDEIVDEIDPMCMMFLINAIYFNGNWKYKFNESDTQDGTFYLGQKCEVTVPFMNQALTAKTMSNDNFSALELPYGRGNFNMLILLPNEDKCLNDILDVWDDETYEQWLGELAEATVEVSLPKFKFKYESVLNDVLKAMNLAVAFDDRADFSKINETADLYINKVKHKSFIDVNEKGTQAAAVTSVEVWATATLPQQFVANRPFLFVIREKYTNAILFMGKVEDPSKE